MIQLILHMVGDYLLQNDWMAQNKKVKGWEGAWACFVHCFTYSVPFVVAFGWYAGIVVFVTHFAIDRTGFVVWFMRITGKG